MTIEAANGATAPPPRRVPAWRNILEILAIVVGVFIGSVLGYLTGFLPAAPIFGMLVPILIATFFLKRRGENWRDLGLRKPQRPGPVFTWAVVAAIGGSFVSIMVALAASRLGLPPSDPSIIVNYVEGDLIHYLWFLIPIAWFSAGLGEEMIARGFLLDRFNKMFGSSNIAAGFAVIAQAALFGAAHAYQDVVGMLSIFALATVFGFVYLKVGRLLWPTVIAHAAIDTFSMTLVYTGKYDWLNF